MHTVRPVASERIENNGHLVMQGFLPLINPPGTPNAQTIHLNFIDKNVICTFKNKRVFSPKDYFEKSNF